MPDFIDDYVRYTADMPSPECYRLWSAITAIGGVLERKVWTMGRAGPIYPNLFTLLVGPPTSGKTNAIKFIRPLWSKINGLNISPDNVTKASLIDVLSRALRTVIDGSNGALIFSSLVVPCGEFGVFLTHNDLEFLSVLTNLYDTPDIYSEERRSTGLIEIVKPTLTILGGTQPDYLNAVMPEEAWGQGFTSRLIMIYADSSPKTDLFSSTPFQTDAIIKHLTEIFQYKGELVWSKQARDEINAWNNAGCPPVPTHSKLLNYNGRRPLHVLKLAMISAVSRSASMQVTVDDFERAKDWLLAAEVKMPDVFHAMGMKSDAQIITDLHFYLYRKWSSVALDKRVPIKEKEIYDFLHTRVPSNNINKIIEVAEKTGYIKRGLYPTEWIPSPLGNFGKI